MRVPTKILEESMAGDGGGFTFHDFSFEEQNVPIHVSNYRKAPVSQPTP